MNYPAMWNDMDQSQFAAVYDHPLRGTIWEVTFPDERYDDSEGDEELARELKNAGADVVDTSTRSHLVVRHDGREIWTDSGLEFAKEMLSGTLDQLDLFEVAA